MVYVIITAMIGISIVLSLISGSVSSLTAGLSEGCMSAVELALFLAGGMCFWSGMCEIMERSGMAKAVSELFSPVIRCLFKGEKSADFVGSVSQNMSANFLGLGNLATASGLKAAKILWEKGRKKSVARLIVLNTASIQLLPTTLCTVRAALGAMEPYGILPHVHLSSFFSVAVGLALCIASEGGKDE